MNKKVLMLLIVLIATASLIVGCSKVNGQEDSATSASVMQSETITSESLEDASEVTGNVEEIKDFMLIITDDDNVSYAFTFEDKPEGMDEIAVGDRVLVTYTGTLSEIDPFMGEFSVKLLSSGSPDDLEEDLDENQNGNAKDLKSLGITDPYVNPDVTFSNLASEEDKAELISDLEKAGIKEEYIKDFIDYVDLYNETAPESVLDGWNTLDKVNYDPYEINEVWVEKYPDFVGVCCRMAAFTLLRDDISVNNADFPKPSMWPLAFDSNSFEMMPIKYMTDENLEAFENFYAPIPTSASTDKEVQKKVIEQALKERGIEFKNSELKFVGLVMHNTVDEADTFLFMDHAGVLYEKNGSVYLLEKLAFQEPYQWIKFPSEEEVIKYFESKYNLDTTGRMAEPIYMINDKLF
ncbi:MAG: DUF4300 family protein [Clostridia bacterium]|nr:DUF4300 family protein [Clostridia bacterium]